jgi:hypothetical protein
MDNMLKTLDFKAFVKQHPENSFKMKSHERKCI